MNNNKSQKIKIDWSGRSHGYSNKEISYLVNIIKNADPLTQGKYLNKLKMIFQITLRRKTSCSEFSSCSFRDYSFAIKLKKR